MFPKTLHWLKSLLFCWTPTAISGQISAEDEHIRRLVREEAHKIFSEMLGRFNETCDKYTRRLEELRKRQEEANEEFIDIGSSTIHTECHSEAHSLKMDHTQ